MVNVELKSAHRAVQLWFRFHLDQVKDIWIAPILCAKMVRLDNFMKYPVTLPVLDDAHHRFEILNSSLRPSWSIKRLVFLDKVAHPLPQCRILSSNNVRKIEIRKLLKSCYALSFYRSKWFLTIQIVLDGYKLFCLGPNCFGQVQIILVKFKLDFYGLTFIIWTQPK